MKFPTSRVTTCIGRFASMLVLTLPLVVFAAGGASSSEAQQPGANPDAQQGQIFPFAPTPQDIQSKTPGSALSPAPGVGGGVGPIPEQQPNPVTASTLMGAKVKDTDGRVVGRLSEIVLDPSGRVSHAIVSVGGFLGVGARYYPVPWKLMDINPSTLTAGTRPWHTYVVVHTTKDRLLGAPRIGRRTIDALLDWRAQGRLGPGEHGETGEPSRTVTPLSRSDDYFAKEIQQFGATGS
jgi:sporulation protein YlmC with PRC-barrel domain